MHLLGMALNGGWHASTQPDLAGLSVFSSLSKDTGGKLISLQILAAFLTTAAAVILITAIAYIAGLLAREWSRDTSRGSSRDVHGQLGRLPLDNRCLPSYDLWPEREMIVSEICRGYCEGTLLRCNRTNARRGSRKDRLGSEIHCISP